jgi:hypothetical protein
MSIRRRLERLEGARAATGCGPDCPPQTVVLYHQDGIESEPSLDEGQRPPAPCPRCGRPALAQEMVVVYDPDFYGTAERLPSNGRGVLTETTADVTLPA